MLHYSGGYFNDTAEAIEGHLGWLCRYFLFSAQSFQRCLSLIFLASSITYAAYHTSGCAAANVGRIWCM